MKVIVKVKDGILGNLLAILFLVGLSGFLVWWGISHDRVTLFIAPVFCLAWLYACGVLVGHIRNPRSAMLGIDGDSLLWKLRSVEAGEPRQWSIPLRSIDRLEFVLPAVRFRKGVRDYKLAEVFIIDVHGNRQQLPEELWPGIYRNRIVAAIKEERPEVRVVERLDNEGNDDSASKNKSTE